MRLFSGFSFGGRRARAGVSSSGVPWVGARASGPAGTYVGVRLAPRPQPLAAYPAEQPRPVATFSVDDEGRVFLGDVELDLDDLREVVRVADDLRSSG